MGACAEAAVAAHNCHDEFNVKNANLDLFSIISRLIVDKKWQHCILVSSFVPLVAAASSLALHSPPSNEPLPFPAHLCRPGHGEHTYAFILTCFDKILEYKHL